MQKRRFGRTGHLSTVAILGAYVFSSCSQEEADAAMEQVITTGVNHIDVAPSYGQAEERLGPWLARERQRFFLGCKTMERTREGATAELRRSLKRLEVDQFDLYQIHAITTMDELDQVTRRGGVLEAMVEAREQGLARHIGITGHGMQSPDIFREALRRFDFDSVLFPVNFVLYADQHYREAADALLAECRMRDVGVMAIKALARAPWGAQPPAYNTWYEPFDNPEHIRQAINFALSQDVTGLCTSGDLKLLPHFLVACSQYDPMNPAEQESLTATAGRYQNIFA